MVRVFTKYDTIVERICVPCIDSLDASELGDDTDIGPLLFKCNTNHSRDYSIKNIADGLAGVKFVHYEVTV